jgi:hypothetical protein
MSLPIDVAARVSPELSALIDELIVRFGPDALAEELMRYE